MKGLRLGMSLTGSRFTPAKLFAAGEAGAWYDPSDLSSMWQDSAGTTPAAVDSPVGKINDKSGNGNHLTQATAAARPILRQSGALFYLEFDGVDDGLASAAGRTWAATSDFCVALEAQTDTTWVTAWDVGNAAGEYLGAVENGSSSSTYSAIGTPTNVVDGATVGTNTRDVLYDAIGTTARVLEVQDAAMAFGTLGLGNYAAYQFGGRIYGIVIHPAATAAKRASLRTWLAAKQGRVL